MTLDQKRNPCNKEVHTYQFSQRCLIIEANSEAYSLRFGGLCRKINLKKLNQIKTQPVGATVLRIFNPLYIVGIFI